MQLPVAPGRDDDVRGPTRLAEPSAAYSSHAKRTAALGVLLVPQGKRPEVGGALTSMDCSSGFGSALARTPMLWTSWAKSVTAVRGASVLLSTTSVSRELCGIPNTIPAMLGMMIPRIVIDSSNSTRVKPSSSCVRTVTGRLS